MKKIRKIYFNITLFFINTFLNGTHFFNLKNFLLKSIGVKIGSGTKIVGPINFSTEVELIIGNNCWIGRNFRIDGNGSVKIGNKCDFAPEILIGTGTHVIGEKTRRAGIGINQTVIIGDSNWIGTRATIIEGAMISNGCIIAAGSLVNKNINENSLVGGVPARLIRILD